MIPDRYAILKKIKSLAIPVGATYLSGSLDIPSATVGRILSRLEADGLLEKVSNKGRVLTPKGRDFISEQELVRSKKKTVDSLIRLTEDTPRERLLEIMQVREMLECHSAALACTNGTEEDLQELNRIMLEYLYELRGGGMGNEQDLRLHLKIAQMSGNQTVLQLLKLILVKDNAYTRFSSAPDSIDHGRLEMHNRIVEAINRRNPDDAAGAMKAHLQQVIGDIAASKEPGPAQSR